MLQFCVAQQHNAVSFVFKATNIRVYTFEEALYHVYHCWKESVDDLLSAPMIAWVAEIGHSFLASKMKDITADKNFTTRIIRFLQLIDYFDVTEIDALHKALHAWEKRLEWEKLKERADYFAHRGEPAKALPLYKRALQYEENAGILNNIAVMYMQLSMSQDALHHITRAHMQEPDNICIMTHYIEACIVAKNYDRAKKALDRLALLAPKCADVPFMHALWQYEEGEYMHALTLVDKAISMDPSQPYYVYKKADMHKKMRQYEKALNTLATIPPDEITVQVIEKEAEIHASAGDIPAAIKCMKKATAIDEGNHTRAWVKLAEYYRKDYDWQRAMHAIEHAITLAPDNDLVRLESARIKKGLGRTREYQTEIVAVLNGFKARYRMEQ